MLKPLAFLRSRLSFLMAVIQAKPKVSVPNATEYAASVRNRFRATLNYRAYLAGAKKAISKSTL